MRAFKGQILVMVTGLLFASLTLAVVAGDVDGNGVVNASDVQAVINGVLNPEGSPAGADIDMNGVVNAQDIQFVINAVLGINIDTDGDGLPDVAELIHGTDPNNPDSDGDGLPDKTELEQATDPNKTDTDDDGLGDGEEYDLGLDPAVYSPVVLINEFLAVNEDGLQDEDGDYPDWLELYNPGTQPVSVAGWRLSNDENDADPWFLPDVTVPAQSYLLVFASGKNRAPVNGENLHASFKLDTDGEYLVLFDDEGNEQPYSVFVPAFPEQYAGYSYGLSDGSHAFRFFDTPTPGAPNTEGTSYAGFLAAPEFSAERGFYEEPLELTLSGQGTLRYTLNGTAPTESNGTVYTTPITLEDNTVIRAAAFQSGWLPSPVETHTYIFNASDAVKSLPVISIVGDEEQALFEPNGVMAIVGGYYEVDPLNIYSQEWKPLEPDDYNNPIQRGPDFEREVSVEFLYPDGGTAYQTDCGIRVQGSDTHRALYRRGGDWSSWDWPESMNKFSLNLFFREEYGNDWLRTPLLTTSENERHDSVTLRAGFGDNTTPFIRDEFARRLHRDMGYKAVQGAFAHLFINGKYKAYYNPCERLSEDTFQDWYDTDLEWDIITQRDYWYEDEGEDTRSGDMVALEAMIEYIAQHPLTDPMCYEELGQMLDIQAFVDYLILELYVGNSDWPQNNWVIARERSDAGIFRFYAWDMENALDDDELYCDLTGLTDGWTPIALLYQALWENDDFRQLFCDRVYHHLFNGGALDTPNTTARYLELEAVIAPALPRMDTYIYDTWIGERPAILLDMLREEDVYTFAGPNFAVNGLAQFGGHVSAGDELTLTNSHGAGSVYYTVDGTDPRESMTLAKTSGLKAIDIDLFPETAPKRYYIPMSDLGLTWTAMTFDDTDWSPAAGGIGYEQSTGYEEYIDADVASMYETASSCYVRIPFTVTQDTLDAMTALTLQLRCDDGFIAYLNGVKVAENLAPALPAWNSLATGEQEDLDAATLQAFSITDLALVQTGQNMLAIHGMNVNTDSSDFLVSGKLVATEQMLIGGIAPTAVEYTEPITLNQSTRVKARILDNGVWSALSDATFSFGPLVDSLRVTEIMYHPPANPDATEAAEFIELTNIGSETINLSMVRFADGIDFTFPSIALAPNDIILLTNDQAAFQTKYGVGLPLVGVYDGRLNNGGERIHLVDATGQTILDFTYNNEWYPLTDGGNETLIVRNPNGALAALNDATGWLPGGNPGGTPGTHP